MSCQVQEDKDMTSFLISLAVFFHGSCICYLIYNFLFGYFSALDLQHLSNLPIVNEVDGIYSYNC